jgi:hypothetical protein
MIGRPAGHAAAAGAGEAGMIVRRPFIALVALAGPGGRA